MSEYVEIATKFLNYFNDAEFDKAASLLRDDCVVTWPNTREIFRGKRNFIEANKNYPGRWFISIEKIYSHNDLVVSVVKVSSDESTKSFHAVSFFKFKDDFIAEIEEYWGENSDPPVWRIEKGYSTTF